MQVINLWGAPGAGKSTIAAGVFYEMKIRGFNVELVNEYAKDAVWENNNDMLKDQLFILANQNRKIERLRDKVDWCITDSPLLLTLAYIPEVYYSNFYGLVYDVWDSYNNWNFLLSRDHAYKQVGRVQNEKESFVIDYKIDKLMTHFDLVYDTIDTSNAVDKILESIG